MSTQVSSQPKPRALYAANVYFQDGTAVTATLVALLYLLLAVSLGAAGYVDNLSILVPVTLGAFALGFLMSVSRFDGFFALTHSMFAGLAWILYLMSRSVSTVDIATYLSNGILERQAQAYFVLLQWLQWVDAAITNVASANNYVFIFEMCFLVWWLTYLGVWSIFRYGYVWRAVIPAGIVILINAYYAPESIVWLLIPFFLLGLLLLVRTNLSEQQLRWRDHRVHFNQDISLDFLRNGLFYGIVVLALALIAPGLGRNTQVRAVLAPVNQQWVETQERVNRLYQGLNRQASPAAAVFGNTLTLSGARNVGNEIVFSVRTPVGRYWRAVVYDTFTGQTWLSTAKEKVIYESEEIVPVANWAMRQPITQTITLQAPTGYVLFSAPDMLQVDVPIDATIRPISAIGSAVAGDAPTEVEISQAHSRLPIDKGDSYTVVSMNTAATVQALRTASTIYPQEILDQYLQLPENFSGRVAQDAIDITAAENTVYDRARALELHLRTYEYNDAIEAPPEGRDPVEYFLYDIRQGYCDYYATSMVLMLRSLGIPSRVVSGYAEGFYNEDMAEFLVSQRDAHTWVEVYFPGYGWIEFEPTAGESQLNRPQALEDESNPYADASSSANGGDFPEDLGGDEMGDPFTDPNAYGENFDFGANSSALPGRFWWLWGLLAPFVLAVGLVFLWRTRVVGPTEFDPNLAPILYERLYNWSPRLGLHRSPSQTPYENAHQLGKAVPEGRAPIASITESYVEFTFGGKQETHGASQTHGAWKQLQPILWRAWLSKKFRRAKPKNKDPYALVE